MSKEEDVLQDRFNKAVAIAATMEPLPPDVMLEFYAHYKQATKGDHFSFNANQHHGDLRGTFKFNAWTQLRGISPKKAKEEYIKLVEKYTNQII